MQSRTKGVISFTLALALTGCFGNADGGPLSSKGENLVAPNAVTAGSLSSFLHDVSQPDPSISPATWILEHHRIPSQGIEMDAWTVRPPGMESVPIVLEVTPYYAGGDPMASPLQTHAFGRAADELVPRGYAYGIVSVLGTGASGGCFTVAGIKEGVATADVVEFLAAQPWSNGNVGLMGVSYPGTAPQDAWLEAPPALKTIVPIAGISDMYRYSFVNGVRINSQGAGWTNHYQLRAGVIPYAASMTSSNVVSDPLSLPGMVTGEVCAEAVEFHEGAVSSVVDGNKDAFWDERDFSKSLRATLDKPRASVYYIHGLGDWNVKPHHMEEWLPLLQQTDVPVKVMLGQWPHAWPQRDDWWEQVMPAWFDQFLKETETGILDAPVVQVQDDSGRWRHEGVWPPIDADELVLYAGSDNSLASEPDGTTGTVRYNDRGSNSAMAPQDANDERIVWTGAPLDEDLVVGGMPRFQATVTVVTGQQANLMLTLGYELSGQTTWTNFAALSLNHAEDLSKGVTDVSGQTIDVDLLFFPQDDLLPAGARPVLVIGGDVAGGPGPSFLLGHHDALVAIDLASVRLVLPIDSSLLVEPDGQ